MARFTYLILLIIFSLLLGCAQVGTISGGERDNAAPKPTEKVEPKNATTNFDVKEIEIVFDEYFVLNDPRSTIKIVPPHATLKTRTKGKSLFISWEDDLQENTTYAIYLNNAIKDYTEGNDSIMQYVFSTGSVIDSLSLNVKVVDAFDNTAQKDVIVALYDPSTNEVLNFTQTNNKGVASLNYLAARTFNLFAFEDLNGDLIPQENERTGFLDQETIRIDSSITLSEPIRLFKSLKEPEISSLTYQPPGAFFIGTNRNLIPEETSLFFNKSILPKENYQFIDKDSILLFLKSESLSSGSFILTSQNFCDTVDYHVLQSQIEGNITIKSTHSDGVFGEHESVDFVLNDLITQIDTSKIIIQNVDDSSFVKPIKTTWEFDTISFLFEKNGAQNLKFTFETEAIKTLNGTNAEYTVPITLYPLKKYGSITADVSYYSTPIILEVIKENETIRRLPITQHFNNPVKIDYLKKGTYSFRIILDENKNGKWDTGDFKTKKQPEKIDNYTTPASVRSNWNIDIILIPEEKGNEESTE